MTDRESLDVQDFSPEAQELYQKIISGFYLEDKPDIPIIRKYKHKRRLRMGIPQLLVIVWTALELATGFYFHDQPVPGRVNGWVQALSCAIKIAVLTAGGFFS